MDDVECTGSETNIQSCTFKGWGENDCDHMEDAGVFCIDGKYITVITRRMLVTSVLMVST
jgi:hypothetical protein